MALEECPACNNAISVNARSCPNCGEPLKPGWAKQVAYKRDQPTKYQSFLVAVVLGTLVPGGIMIGISSLFDEGEQTDPTVIAMPAPAPKETRPAPLTAPQPEVAKAAPVTPPPVRPSPPPPPMPEPTALQQMVQVFEGNLSQSDIKYYLDKALVAFGEPVNEDTYRRAGNALVVMRKNTGVPELDILRCVVATDGGKYGSFADMAAVCATILAK